MTQLEAFQGWVVYYRDGAGQSPDPRAARVNAVKAMRSILDVAQNSPPDGGSDGSFTRESWTMARDLVACMALLERVEAEIQSTSARFLAGGKHEVVVDRKQWWKP